MYNKKVELIDTTTKVLKDNFWDGEFGGVYSATNNYNNPVTLEKKIIDQVYTLLSAYHTHHDDLYSKELKYIISWLSDCGDNLVEIKEQYDYPTDMGTFKTTNQWYQVANILFYLGKKGSNEELLKISCKVAELLDKHTYKQNSGTYLSKVSADWIYSVDGLLDNLTLVLAAIHKLQIYSDNQSKENLDSLFQTLETVERILQEGNHIVSVLNLDKSLSVDSKITLQGQCYLIYLYKTLYKQFGDEKYNQTVDKVISYTNEKFWDKKYSGYFSFVDIDGEIRIHKEFVVLLTPKTPAKYTFDNALFLQATVGTDFEKSKRYGEATDYLLSLYDETNCGFFIAEGYFWAAPGIPVGPFLRSVSPTIDTAGVVYFGSTKYVHFSNKYPTTQAICSLVINNQSIDFVEKEHKTRIPSTITPHFSNIDYNPTEHQKVDLSDYIDVEKHLKWINNLYTPGQGFGWTPYESPLGVKANKTSAIFGTQHALANIRILDGDLPEPESLAYWISLSQNEDGAFSEAPGLTSDVLYTYLAVNALSIIGMIGVIDKAKCIQYLLSCQNKDGGFGINPGYKSDMFHSNLALATLYTLDTEPKSNEGILHYTSSAAKEDGGYSEYANGSSDTYSCYRAVSTYCMYGLELPKKEKTIKFLKSCQKNDGGFAQDVNGTSSLIATYHAVAALYMLNSEPSHLTECIKYLSACQAPDGGIANIPKASTGTIDEGFAGIQSLAMLTKQLDRAYATIIS